MDGLNNKIDRAEGRINELEDRAAVIMHSVVQQDTEKKNFKRC